MTVPHRGVRWSVLAAAALLASCNSSGTPPGSPSPRAGTATPAASTPVGGGIAGATAAGAPQPTAAPRATVAGCPPGQAFTSLPVLARTGGHPDDLAATADGGLWISDEQAGRVLEVDASGRVLLSFADADGPEGIVLLPDGRMLLAEQRLDRVVSLRPPSTVRTPVLALTPVPGADGVDGLGFDRERGFLLVPDSAAGALRTATPEGAAPRTLATGLGRPVAADVGPDGALYVAAENAAGLLRIPRDGGAAARVGTQQDLDEVLSVGGLLYVAALGPGTLSAVDPATGASRVLVTGAVEPQGLAVLPDGRLALSDSGRGVVATLAACR